MKKTKKKNLQKNIVVGGGNNDTIKFTGEFKKVFDNYKLMFENVEKLENHYDKFWNNIYFNDTFAFYKFAIQYYQDICNGNPCYGFTKLINEKLITGKCDFVDKYDREIFINDKNEFEIDLCEFIVQIINNLDRVFQICPKLPFPIIVYRHETRKLDDSLLQIKKGEYYRNNNFMSTTTNCWYLMNENNIIGRLNHFGKDNINLNFTIIEMEIILPEKTMAYYINYPFDIKKEYDIYYGRHEFEILLQRNNIFEIIETKTIGKIFFITMELKLQFNHSINSVKKKKSKIILPSIIDKNEYQNNLLKHNSYIDYKMDKEKNNFIMNQKYNIYNEMLKKIKKRTPTKYFSNIYIDKLDYIETKYLIEWKNKKPKYSEKKYYMNENLFNNVYNTFINLTTHYKQQNAKIIYTNYLYNSLLFASFKLFVKIINNEEIINEIFEIKYPMFITKKMSPILFGEFEYFLCNKKGNNARKYDNYYSINHTFPITIILKYTGDITYYPTQIYDGITFDIQEIQIKKINKIQLTQQFFFYLIEAIKPIKSE